MINFIKNIKTHKQLFQKMPFLEYIIILGGGVLRE